MMEYGRIKSWIHFDGVDDYVEVENSPNIEPQNLTVIELFNPKSLNRADIICKYNGYNEGWRIIWNAQGNKHFLMEINYGDSSPDALYTNKSYDLGLHVVAFTYDHANIKNYVDGQLDGTLAETGDINYTDSAYLTIGARNNTPDFPFIGNIYLIAIYNEAKSDDFIKKFYNAWQYGEDMRKFIDSSTVLWLDGDSIDEDAGLWRDVSGNGNDGTIYGAKKVSNVGVIEE